MLLRGMIGSQDEKSVELVEDLKLKSAVLFLGQPRTWRSAIRWAQVSTRNALVSNKHLGSSSQISSKVKSLPATEEHDRGSWKSASFRRIDLCPCVLCLATGGPGSSSVRRGLLFACPAMTPQETATHLVHKVSMSYFKSHREMCVSWGRYAK